MAECNADSCPRLFYLLAVTPLHPGVGRAEGAHVDLPVQRDEFDMPVIWSSSVKGAVRSAIAQRVKIGVGKLSQCQNDDCRKYFAAFGPEAASEEVSEYAAAAAFLDAKLLMIPARSLRGVWLYATTPHMLRVFHTYREAAGLDGGDEILKIADEVNAAGKAFVSSGDFLVDGRLVINELFIDAAIRGDLAGKVEGLLPEGLRRELARVRGRLEVAVVPDEYGLDVVRRSLIVQYRVRLDRATKTVAEGALWSEEYVPQFAVFVSALICKKPKAKGLDFGAADVCNFVKEKLGAAFELGGKETIGKGLVKPFWHD